MKRRGAPGGTFTQIFMMRFGKQMGNVPPVPELP